MAGASFKGINWLGFGILDDHGKIITGDKGVGDGVLIVDGDAEGATTANVTGIEEKGTPQYANNKVKRMAHGSQTPSVAITMLDMDYQALMAPGILSITHGGLLDADKKANRARQFMKQISNSDGGPIVLDDLEEYQPLEIKADVAKLLAQTDWTGKQIAKVFGIPDSYLNGQGDQQSNIDQIKGMYANALNRYMQSIISELSIKFNCEIKADIRPAIDPLNNSYASAISSITKNGVLAQNQAAEILQQVGYLPDNLPTPVNNNPVKGGDDNGQEDSD